jgi:hypothetical protein
MAHFQEGSSPTLSNFASGTSGQTNSFWVPEIYSKNVQMFFRKASVAEAITNTDYTGEISAYGDTVNIIKEPTITVYDYTRGANTTQTMLTDQELVLIVDQAKAFKFKVDDLEKRMSHVNWIDIASKSAAYSLKDSYDTNILTYIGDQVSASAPDNIIGADDATADDLPNLGANESVHLGYGSGMTDPLDLMSRISRMFDEANVPEEGRWFLASPKFYEILAAASSKLLSVDYNGGQGSIRNGLVSTGLLRGFTMYKSNNMPATSAAEGVVFAGHMSAVSTAGTLIKTESYRDQDSFGDVVRGLHVYGRKVLRPEALAKAFWSSTSDA